MDSYDTKWRFLDSGKESAIFNMALDEAILYSVNDGLSLPTFRLYEWDKPSITIGFSQKTDTLLDLTRCRVSEIEIAKRPTGGRAVYHANDLAYSIIAPVDDSVLGGSIAETYRAVSEILRVALQSCGVDAVISEGKSGKTGKLQSGQVNPCFLSASRFELTVSGKKISGSAQRRYKNTFIQQGSILIGDGYEKIADYLKDESSIPVMKQLLRENSIHADAVSGKAFTVEALKESLLQSFQNIIGTTIENSDPTAHELEAAGRFIAKQVPLKGEVSGHD